MPYYYLMALLLIFLAVYSAVHALLHKTDSRAAFGWIVVSLLLPLFGPSLYFLFGVNRVHERAIKLDHSSPDINYSEKNYQPDIPASLRNVDQIAYHLTKLPLVGGNSLKILFSGVQAYPAMLESINEAKKSIYLSTYIFKVDALGNQFIRALINAKDRGVDVYVLIDGVGEYYSKVKARKLLDDNKVKVCRFLPLKLIPFNMYINLRNHRKLLVIDDELCFVGGMNISNEYVSSDIASLKDIHFRIKGNLTYQLKDLFKLDWSFASGEVCKHESDDFIISNEASWCRVVSDGPGEHLGYLSIVLFSAINAASKNIIIMTPYFLPNKVILRALQVAALRGVDVSIILPVNNNLNFVNWACRHILSQLIPSGVKVYYQPPPFDHSKLFLVDDFYSLVGSANIDPRSLRLNYEIGVEIYDATMGLKLAKYSRDIIQTSRQVTTGFLEQRSLLVKIRDGIAWLFSPYL